MASQHSMWVVMPLPLHLPCSMTVALYALVSQKDTHGLLADRSSVFCNFVLCGLAALQQSLLCLVTSQTQPPDEEFQVFVPLYEILCFTKSLHLSKLTCGLGIQWGDPLSNLGGDRGGPSRSFFRGEHVHMAVRTGLRTQPLCCTPWTSPTPAARDHGDSTCTRVVSTTSGRGEGTPVTSIQPAPIQWVDPYADRGQVEHSLHTTQTSALHREYEPDYFSALVDYNPPPPRIVVVRSPCQENYAADAHPSVLKSMLESANPPHGLGVCTWMHLGQQPVSGTADPRSSQTGQVIQGLR